MGSNINLYEDFSGVALSSNDPNPYNALLEACDNDPVKIQSVYQKHREARAAKQRAFLLSDSFEGVNPDEILRSLLIEDSLPNDQKTGYLDPRNCLVLWVRPPSRVKLLVRQIQDELKKVVPNMWFMPLQNLHSTALELTHSLAPDELDAFALSFKPMVKEATNFLSRAAKDGKLASLEKPMVTFDASAVALSFLPSVQRPEDGLQSNESINRDTQYTYHHLRRDLWDICSSTSLRNCQPLIDAEGANTAESRGLGVPIKSRYVVPSIHLTIGRFVSREDTSTNSSSSSQEDQAHRQESDPEKVQNFVDKIDEINQWMQGTFHGACFPNEEIDGGRKNPASWIVGEEIGLDCIRGRLWYGGGERIRMGQEINA